MITEDRRGTGGILDAFPLQITYPSPLNNLSEDRPDALIITKKIEDLVKR